MWIWFFQVNRKVNPSYVLMFLLWLVCYVVYKYKDHLSRDASVHTCGWVMMLKNEMEPQLSTLQIMQGSCPLDVQSIFVVMQIIPIGWTYKPCLDVPVYFIIQPNQKHFIKPSPWCTSLPACLPQDSICLQRLTLYLGSFPGVHSFILAEEVCIFSWLPLQMVQLPQPS